MPKLRVAKIKGFTVFFSSTTPGQAWLGWIVAGTMKISATDYVTM